MLFPWLQFSTNIEESFPLPCLRAAWVAGEGEGGHRPSWVGG